MARTAIGGEEGALGAVIVALALAVLGLAGGQVASALSVFLDPTLAETPSEATLGARTALTILNFVGMAAVGGLYLALTGRGRSYVDLRVPTLRDWLHVLAGIGGTILVYALTIGLVSLLDLPTADNQIVVLVGDDERMVLVLIAVAFLFNAPAEEFLFRNVIQKRLYGAFGRSGAVVAASAIFAAVHLPVYLALAEAALAALVPVGVVFAGSLVFGAVYARTDNLLVPTLAHATYNAFVFSLLYLSMVTGMEFEEVGSSLLVALLVDAVAALPA